jgi:PhnB protein
MASPNTTFFAPHLYIKSGNRNLDFYINGMGAVELRRFSNDDGTIHVSELSIDGNIFHVHEEKPSSGQLEPIKINGVTALVGLFVEDVDKLITKAINAGATMINPPQDYDYGYRQGEIKDPFGHIWLIQKKIA